MRQLKATLSLLSLSASVSAASTASHATTTALLELAEHQPGQAIQVLEARLQQQPDWHRGWLELARLYYRTGQYTAARRTIRDLVKRAELPPQVQKNVQAFYQQILTAEQHRLTAARHQPRLNYYGRISLARGYDGNANGGPENQDIGVSHLILRPEALQRSDHYDAAELQLQSHYRLTTDSPSASTAGYRGWRNQLALYQRRYHRDNQADLAQLTLSSELSQTLTPHWQLGIEARATDLDYGHHTRIHSIGIAPFVRWQRLSHQLRWEARITHRDYLHHAAEGKKSWQHQLRARYRYQPAPQWRVQAGLTLLDNDARSDRYSYHASEVEAQLQYRASPTLALQLTLRQRYSQYEGAETPLYDDARDERYTTARLGIGYRITPRLEIQANLSSHDNQANHKLHDYQRTLAELKLSWRFQGAK